MTKPSAYTTACEFCGRALDIRDVGVFQHASGWVMTRSGGGAHGVSLMQRDRRWAHRACVETAASGYQASMFSAPS
jgi:hypothetical protein